MERDQDSNLGPKAYGALALPLRHHARVSAGVAADIGKVCH